MAVRSEACHRAPARILQGQGDTLLPMTHAQHTADVVPSATLRVLPQHGHFSTLGELPSVAAGLAA
jgi:pimeloyl-ACP methyl ester carboxylesterase